MTLCEYATRPYEIRDSASIIASTSITYMHTYTTRQATPTGGVNGHSYLLTLLLELV